MTDINKAIAFARECLKWERPESQGDRIIGHLDGLAYYSFAPYSAQEIQVLLDGFLAKRFYIQINRGTTSLFRWSVIVGLQDLTAPGAHHTQARADSDDLCEAIFDACVMAARMDK